MYADGIVYEQGNEGVSRLIFYQNERQISEDSTEFDRTEDIKRLKFEVRIPHFAMSNLATNVRYRDNARSKGMELVENKDEKTIEAFYSYAKELSDILFDTENLTRDNPNAKQLQEVRDKLEHLSGTAMRNLNDED